LKNVKIVRDPATFPENRDKNVSKFEINVDKVDVVISFLWWLQGTICNHISIDSKVHEVKKNPKESFN
jgi:hypothetical protein